VTEQDLIIEALGVHADFEAETEARRRVEFLAIYLKAAGLQSYLLGISGGVDSLAAALLAQRAINGLRDEGHKVSFIAVRLPYGAQADESDAQRALDTIGADHLFTVNIKPAADAMLASLRTGGLEIGDAAREDFLLGNIKARQRMIAQFALAGANRGLVIGTDHAAEALMGFFTKFGDGAADVLPLSGLNKRRVRALAQHLVLDRSLSARSWPRTSRTLRRSGLTRMPTALPMSRSTIFLRESKSTRWRWSVFLRPIRSRRISAPYRSRQGSRAAVRER
jgi:NAD+ synthase